MLILDGLHLEIARTYLFGTVKFLDLLGLLMMLDIITGVTKAWKNNKLRSRSAWFGYIRKILVFVVVILANVVDQVLALNGVLTYGTVLFYVGNEALSIVENLAEIGIPVPDSIKDRLNVVSEKQVEKGEDK
jgi:toxin secretion/phage lysis holin